MSIPTTSKLCIICKSDDTESKFNLLYEKGMDSLIKKCVNDEFKNLREDLLNKKQNGIDVHVHINCRNRFITNYNRVTAQSLSVDTNAQPPTKKLRYSGSNVFNYKRNCFICEKTINFKSLHRDKVRYVRTISIWENLKKLYYSRELYI